MVEPELDALSRYSSLAVAVDVVAFTLVEGQLHVLLVTRGIEPFVDQLALPGGFVLAGEGLDAAAIRELQEETGLTPGIAHVEQLRAYGEPGRDPRGRVLSVAYLALAPELPHPTAGSDAREARWVPVADALALDLAFDHGQILRDGLERARAKLEYTSLATAFCADEFTVSDLRAVYEAVWGYPLDPRNFPRKLTGTPGLLVDPGRTRHSGQGRPASLFRAGTIAVLNPPLTRDEGFARP